MSDTTRSHRPTTASPRYTKTRGIGRDRMRWPASLGTFRHRDLAAAIERQRAADKETPRG